MKNIYKTSKMKILLKFIAILVFFSNISYSAEIGIVGFVIGDAFNQDGKKLNVGDPIYFGDTIKTNEGGKSQILFVDQTVMTVGSNTELTIDEFVYDAENTDGKLLSTIKSGKKNKSKIKDTTKSFKLGNIIESNLLLNSNFFLKK